MSAASAQHAIDGLLGLQIVEVDLELVLRAVQIQRRFRTSYWDALVLAAAQRAGCPTLWSEDFNSGQDYDGVVVQNPFAAA